MLNTLQIIVAIILFLSILQFIERIRIIATQLNLFLYQSYAVVCVTPKLVECFMQERSNI